MPSSAASGTTARPGPRGSVPPPVHVWLKSPGLADHAHKLGAHVRFGTQFTQKQTEIAILMTARYWTAQFEWAAHVRLGAAGRGDAGRRSTRSPSAARRNFTDPDDQLVYDFCKDYYDDHRVDDATYARVVARWGEKRHCRSRRADRLLLVRFSHPQHLRGSDPARSEIAGGSNPNESGARRVSGAAFAVLLAAVDDGLRCAHPSPGATRHPLLWRGWEGWLIRQTPLSLWETGSG